MDAAAARADAGRPKREAGAGPTPPTCYDEDLLPYQQELDAGLDPCREDTDGDGCSDDQELLLGGCDDPRRRKLAQACHRGLDAQVVLQFRVDGRSGELVELTAAPSSDLQIEAVSQERGDAGRSATVVVPASGLVEFAIRTRLDSAEGLETVALKLKADGTTIDEGAVLLDVRGCPLVI